MSSVVARWLCCAGLCNSLLAAELHFAFNRTEPGTTPPGFRSTVAGDGPPGDWQILLDDVEPALPSSVPDSAPKFKKAVVAQLSRDDGPERFPMLVYEKETFGDFKLSMRFKLVDGKTERMAGIAFRMQDERNFYYVRASGLGGTFNFFKVVNGQRSQPIGNKVEIPSGVWHELTLECRGTRIQAWLNGREVLPPLDDTSFRQGRVAFWTKSDSVSYFADGRIEYKPRESLAKKLVRESLAKFSRLEGLKISVLEGDPPRTVIVASDDPAEVGSQGWPEERNVIQQGQVYQAKQRGRVAVSLPLRDRNGEPIAAVRVLMKSFPGQTEQNALIRATPVVERMKPRVMSLEELLQ